jgi:hypothetical protein
MSLTLNMATIRLAKMLETHRIPPQFIIGSNNTVICTTYAINLLDVSVFRIEPRLLGRSGYSLAAMPPQLSEIEIRNIRIS